MYLSAQTVGVVEARLLFWYVIEGRKVIIHDAWLIKEKPDK